MLNWLFKVGVVSDTTPPSSSFGFVYLITLKDGKKYIGRKSFWSTVKKKLTVQEMEARPSKRHKDYKLVTKESSWRKYSGSSKLFGSREIAEKRILQIAKTKRHLSYLETKYLFKADVLESDEYLNDSIGGRYFRGNLI